MDMIVRKCIDHFYGRVLAFCRMLYSLKVSFNGSDTRVSVSFYQCYQLVNSNGKQKKTECIECICGSSWQPVTISNFHTIYLFHAIRCEAIIYLFIHLSSCLLEFPCLLVVFFSLSFNLVKTALLSGHFVHSFTSIY